MTTLSVQQNAIKENYNKNALAEVTPGLWIGGLGALQEIKNIPRNWTIISVLHSDRLQHFVQTCLDETESNDSVRIENWVVWDLPDLSSAQFLSPKLDNILQLIDLVTSSDASPPRACLVHCAAGISRSASIIAAWLLSRRKCKTLEDTMNCLRNARPEINPNMGFLSMLRDLEHAEEVFDLISYYQKCRSTIEHRGSANYLASAEKTGRVDLLIPQ